MIQSKVKNSFFYIFIKEIQKNYKIDLYSCVKYNLL